MKILVKNISGVIMNLKDVNINRIKIVAYNDNAWVDEKDPVAKRYIEKGFLRVVAKEEPKQADEKPKAEVKTEKKKTTRKRRSKKTNKK